VFSVWAYIDKEKWLDNKKCMLSLIATVFAITTYKTATNPPGGVYSLEKITKMCTSINKYDKICSGEAIMSVVQPELYSKVLNMILSNEMI